MGMFPSVFGPQVLPKSKGSGSGFQIYEHSYFGGQWTYPDRAQVDQRGALNAVNMRWINRQVGTRLGFGPAFSYTDANVNTAVSMFNWISDLGNYLVWANWNSPAMIFVASIAANPTPTVTQLATPWLGILNNFTSYAQVGPNLYTAAHIPTVGQNTIQPAGPASVITKTSGTLNIDKIIPGPPTNTQVPNGTFAEPGAGTVTAGQHSFGVRMLHRSGFLGRPGPDTSTTANPTPLTFAPWTFTSAGAKNLQWTFTPTTNWPADVVQVQLVMNTVANPNRYFLVPGQVQNVTGGAMTSVIFTVNIDDGSLVSGAAANECTNSLNFYTASATGQAYMNVAAVTNIGNRMFYLTKIADSNRNLYWVVFASDPGFYQQISLDQHLLQLPNQIQISSVFGFQGSVYLLGPHWTYYTQDNGQTPVNWMNPQLVDGKKGAYSPQGVGVSANGQYVWVADKTGLYQFTGSYPTLPTSYNQTDQWNSSFSNAFLFYLKDDPTGRRVICSSSLLSIWDYTLGFDTYLSRYSQQFVLFSNGFSISPSGSELVINSLFLGGTNPSLGNLELWTVVSNGTSVYFQREKNPLFDALPYRDDGGPNGPFGIMSSYEPPIFPVPSGEYDYLTHIGCKLRVIGSGLLVVSVANFDSTSSVILNPSLNLSSPISGKQELRGYLVSNNGFVYHFIQQTLDAHFVLDEIDMYYQTYGSFL